MKKEIIFFLFIKSITYIYNYIVLPIDTLKRENYKTLYPKNSPRDIISNEYFNSFFTELEIGTPSQKIPLLVKVKTNDYVITSMHLNMEENLTDYYYINKILYNFFDNFLNNFNFFNENISSTFSSKNCMNRKKNQNNDDIPIAEKTCPSYDIFNLCEDINMKNKNKEKNLYFELVRNMKDNVTGVLGLGLYDLYYRTTSSFLYLLKKNNITKNFYWFFEFDSHKSEKGKLIIGSLLDEIYEDKYDRNDIVYAKANQGILYWEINFDKIFVKNTSDIYELESDNCELNYDSNIIGANRDYANYFKELIKDLLSQKKCFIDYIEGKNDFYSIKNNWTYYYCKNEKEIKDELKRIILPIKFFSSEFNYTFEITIDDILKETNEYIFIKILLQEFPTNWILGKPFSLKYKFIFNPEIKQIGFYPKFKTKKGFEINWNITIKVILIILLCIIFAILGIIIGKKLYGIKRKKRANEMNDDDYEYFTENKKNNENEHKGKNYDTNIIN